MHASLIARLVDGKHRVQPRDRAGDGACLPFRHRRVLVCISTKPDADPHVDPDGNAHFHADTNPDAYAKPDADHDQCQCVGRLDRYQPRQLFP